MLSRKNRRRKDTGPMFPFGEIMLPVIGLVALGILILSVKMFFLPSGDDKLYQNIHEENGNNEIERVIEEEKDVDISVKPESYNTQKSSFPDNSAAVAVAVPVNEGEPSTSETDREENDFERTQGNNNGNPGDTSVEASANRPSTSTNTADQNSSWGVQIGSFKEIDAAESLSAQVQQSGYSVVTQQAEVKGDTYHRVIVLAGNSRGNATEMEKKLKVDGFPTFVKRIR